MDALAERKERPTDVGDLLEVVRLLFAAARRDLSDLDGCAPCLACLRAKFASDA